MFSDDTPEDLEKTTKMDEEPAAKPPKKPGDWVTAPMPAAPKPKAQPQPPASSAPPPSEAGTPPPPVAQPAAPPPAYSSEAPPQQTSGGGFGSFLSNVGINDPNIQKWVLIGLGVLVLVCCLCVCIAGAASLLSSASY